MFYFTLNDGNKLPALGLGTFPMKKDVLDHAVKHFLSHTEACDSKLLLDSARDYGNEKDLGVSLSQLICKSVVSRERLFVTTKIGNRQQMRCTNSNSLIEDIKSSLRSLQLDYVDLLLMHWPLPDHYVYTWKMMEEVKNLGLARSIGICNFRIRHITKLLETSTIVPAVNQIEVHPLRTAKCDISFCQQQGIQVQAYCPLGLMDERIKNSQTLQKIANNHHKDIAQIILRWNFQNGLASVPKSSSPKRIDSNFSIFDFELSDSEISSIDAMNQDYKFYSESFYCPGY